MTRGTIRTTGRATPAEATEAARDWDSGVLSCRASGHQWQATITMANSRYDYYQARWLCNSCGAVKTQEFAKRTGQVFSTWITYPEGYASPVGRITGPARDALRLARAKRFRTGRFSGDPYSSAARSAVGAPPKERRKK